jgi:hypothetical protein
MKIFYSSKDCSHFTVGSLITQPRSKDWGDIADYWIFIAELYASMELYWPNTKLVTFGKLLMTFKDIFQRTKSKDRVDENEIIDILGSISPMCDDKTKKAFLTESLRPYNRTKNGFLLFTKIVKLLKSLLKIKLDVFGELSGCALKQLLFYLRNNLPLQSLVIVYRFDICNQCEVYHPQRPLLPRRP